MIENTLRSLERGTITQKKEKTELRVERHRSRSHSSERKDEKCSVVKRSNKFEQKSDYYYDRDKDNQSGNSPGMNA
jgi:hypothetical protein